MKRWKKVAAILMATVMTVTACGSSKAKSSADGSGEYADELNIYIWSEYIDDQVIADFEKKYGIKVNVSFFTSTDELLAKVMTGGGSEYDLIQPNTNNLAALREMDYIEKLDFDNIPNYKYVKKSYIDGYFDNEDAEYAVPYMAGTTVIAYNKKTCPIEIKSFDDLLNPALKGQIVSITSSQNVMSMVLAHLGYDPNSVDESEIAKAGEWLEQLKPNIKVFDGDAPRKPLLNGECSVGIIYGGDIAIAMNEQPDTFVIPQFSTDDFKYGIGTSNFCVPKGAKHKKEAELFINWIQDPKNYARCLDTYPYMSTNTEAEKYVSDEYKNMTVYQLTDEQLSAAYSKADLGDAQVIYDKYWSKFMNQ